MLLGVRRRRRPPGRRPPRHRAPRVQLRRRLRRATWSSPYVADHAAGRTPNPCIECNRHLKFDRLLAPGRRARLRRRRHRPPRRASPTAGRLAARVAGARTRPRTSPTCCTCSTRPTLGAGPVPDRRADQGRGRGPRPPGSACAPPTSPTARTCASSPRPSGRGAFLGDRIPLHAGPVVDADGRDGRHGRRGRAGDDRAAPRARRSRRRPARATRVDVDVATATVTVGGAGRAAGRSRSHARRRVVGGARPGRRARARPVSAHGAPACLSSGRRRRGPFDVPAARARARPVRRALRRRPVSSAAGGLTRVDPPSGRGSARRRWPSPRRLRRAPRRVESGSTHGRVAVAAGRVRPNGPARLAARPSSSSSARPRAPPGSRSSPSRSSASAGPSRRTRCGGTGSVRSRRERVVDHDPGGDEHQPPPAQQVQLTGRQGDHGHADRRSRGAADPLRGREQQGSRDTAPRPAIQATGAAPTSTARAVPVARRAARCRSSSRRRSASPDAGRDRGDSRPPRPRPPDDGGPTVGADGGPHRDRRRARSGEPDDGQRGGPRHQRRRRAPTAQIDQARSEPTTCTARRAIGEGVGQRGPDQHRAAASHATRAGHTVRQTLGVDIAPRFARRASGGYSGGMRSHGGIVGCGLQQWARAGVARMSPVNLRVGLASAIGSLPHVDQSTPRSPSCSRPAPTCPPRRRCPRRSA